MIPELRGAQNVVSEIQVLRNYIDGAFVDAKDGRTLPVLDPTTGEVYANSPLSG